MNNIRPEEKIVLRHLDLPPFTWNKNVAGAAAYQGLKQKSVEAFQSSGEPPNIASGGGGNYHPFGQGLFSD